MNGSDNRPKDKQAYGYMDKEKEMKSEIEQSGDSMEEAVVVKDSEINGSEKKKKRRFTAQDKMRILREVDLCKGKHGAVGAFLRREGLYSSSLVEWRRQRDSGTLNAFSQKRGRKLKKTAEVIEAEKWKKRSTYWEKRFRYAMVVIEAQKKMSEILGIEMVDTSHLEEPEQ